MLTRRMVESLRRDVEDALAYICDQRETLDIEFMHAGQRRDGRAAKAIGRARNQNQATHGKLTAVVSVLSIVIQDDK